jgi:sec-independent protein translocase protein TatC
MSTADKNIKDSQLIEHLIEIRVRLLRVLASIFLIFCCLFYFSSNIYDAIAQPIISYLPQGNSLIATDLTSTFFAPFKLTIVLSLFLAMPIILFEFWKFITPGLYPIERKTFFPLIFLSVILFYGGVAFAFFIVFPVIISFFVSIAPNHVSVTPDISLYLSTVLKLLWAFGIAFQIPILTASLIWMETINVSSMKKKRPYVIVFCFVFGMLLTPPDPLSQTLLAIPMWLLFELGLIIGSLKAHTNSH